MVTLHVAADEWPERLQRPEWLPRPEAGPTIGHGSIVRLAEVGTLAATRGRPDPRVSLGRDGVEVLQLSDDEVLDAVLADLALHLGVAFDPLEVRITRWPGAFAQYRPHHASWVDAIEDNLPSGIFVTGAGFRGIGIPACVRSGAAIAGRTSTHLANLEESSP